MGISPQVRLTARRLAAGQVGDISENVQTVKGVKLLAASVPDVVMTVVEQVMPEEKIAVCRRICDELGVTLRVRAFES